ncbi:histidine phosphatase family protein [Neobacillus niacini]|uniref:histidine phosphatase family protein n=1 Tax=Neobacillus niacini TaxID=86668 RepID=UPI002FFE44C8
MEISLIRHGKSLVTENNSMTVKEFKKWVEKYDNSGVFEESLYPSDTKEKILAAKIVITSDLTRAIESAKLLNPKVNIINDPLFREVELPTFSLKLIDVKLRPSVWAVILRSLWFIGVSTECESLIVAKLRAKEASQQLIDYACKYQSVILVGHGFFNMLIAKELEKKGWKGKRKREAKHWQCNTYFVSN